MTTETTTNDTPDDATETATVDTETDESTPNSEAAKYRRRLRDTEAERDGLRERVSALQRSEAERLAGETLRKGDSLWLTGVDIADLLDDTGRVDPAKVATAADDAHRHYGLEGRARFGGTADAGARTTDAAPAQATWSKALKGN